MKILIVEDDKMLGEGLQSLLRLQSYEADLAYDMESTKKKIEESRWDFFILDLWLPDGDGRDLCRWIRTRSKAPVLFLTACEEESAVVEGLRCGGDDYVVKPFRTMELLARIEALTRRNTAGKEVHSYKNESRGIRMDAGTRLCHAGDRILRVPLEEWKILWCLLEAEGKMVAKEELRQAVWEDGADYVEENTSRVMISRLRRHLAEIGIEDVIETCRGQGYRWVLPMEEEDGSGI